MYLSQYILSPFHKRLEVHLGNLVVYKKYDSRFDSFIMTIILLIYLFQIVLALSYSSKMQKSFTNWFDPFINLWQIAPGMTKNRNKAGLGVIKDTFVLALGDVINSSSQSVEMLDLSSQSPCWVQIVDMLVSRQHLGVGILDDSVYAVSYTNIYIHTYIYI